MDSKNQNYNKIHILEIDNLENFILWIREQSYTLAIRHIGHLFFNDQMKYENEIIDDEIDDEEVFIELFPNLIEDESIANKYYITSKDAAGVIKNIANKFLYNFINQLVDCNILEMCWDKNREDFIWRLTKK